MHVCNGWCRRSKCDTPGAKLARIYCEKHVFNLFLAGPLSLPRRHNFMHWSTDWLWGLTRRYYTGDEACHWGGLWINFDQPKSRTHRRFRFPPLSGKRPLGPGIEHTSLIISCICVFIKTTVFLHFWYSRYFKNICSFWIVLLRTEYYIIHIETRKFRICTHSYCEALQLYLGCNV